MEQLGYTFKNDPDRLRQEVETARICFLHAPLFHPALKTVGPIRKNLGIRTFFNMLGPMVNPAFPGTQLVGVYNLEMARIYNYLLQQTGGRFTIIHSLDGYDEISLTGDTKVITNQRGKDHDAGRIGQKNGKCCRYLWWQYGGRSGENVYQILKWKGAGRRTRSYLANAAMALHSTGTYAGYEEAYDAAVDSLESGKAYEALEKLISLQ